MSHMGQVILPAGAVAALEALVPVDIAGLAVGRQRYAMFTDAAGGILDDLMVAKTPEHLFVVVNAACAPQDIAHLRAHVEGVQVVSDRALLALQGPGSRGGAGCWCRVWRRCLHGCGRVRLAGRRAGCRARALPARTISRPS